MYKSRDDKALGPENILPLKNNLYQSKILLLLKNAFSITESLRKCTSKVSKRSHLAHLKPGQHHVMGMSFFPEWVDSCR